MHHGPHECVVHVGLVDVDDRLADVEGIVDIDFVHVDQLVDRVPGLVSDRRQRVAGLNLVLGPEGKVPRSEEK